MSLIIPKTRNSFLLTNQIYFWTATVNNWYHLLAEESFKTIIIDSWQYLTDLKKIDIYAFVIMPNHLHLIWQINKSSGKESAQGSFLKYTAHQFQKALRESSNDGLANYKVKSSNKNYEFWQRDSLGIPLFTRDVAFQKLNYIHNNPLARHWKLAEKTTEYQYSSAKFYQSGESEYKFLNNLWRKI